jgi:Ca2+-binding RTX toxin-like protein
MATAATLLGATPAFAADVATVGKTVTDAIITGTAVDDSIVVTGSGYTITVRNLNGPLAALPGCNPVGVGVVECPAVGLVRFNGFNGSDRFENHTSVPSTVYAGAQNDVIVGGSSNDELFGDSGSDTIDAEAGTDRCVAETEYDCELN